MPEPVSVGGNHLDPRGDVLEAPPHEEFLKPSNAATFDRRMQCFTCAFTRDRCALALIEHAPPRTNSRAQRKVAQHVSAETVDCPNAGRIDVGRQVAPSSSAQCRTHFTLEIGRRLVRERDCRNLLERERAGDRSNRRLLRNGHAELMADRLHNCRGLSRAGARIHQQSARGARDDLQLRIGQGRHHRVSSGPPGIRQMSRAGQYGEQAHDLVGLVGKSPARICEIRAPAPSSASCSLI